MRISPYTGFYNPSNPKEFLFGEKIFSTGMLIWTPDIFAFRFLNISESIATHFLFALLISVWSFNSIRVKLGFSYVTAASLTITWVLSAPIVARISEGHIQLLGYLMVPYFLTLVDDAIKSKQGESKDYKKFQIGMILGYITLLGSAHVFFQFSLILFSVAVFYKRARRTVLSGLALGWGYSAFQYLPGILSPVFNRQERSVYHGYGWRFWEEYFNWNGYYLLTWPEILMSILKIPVEISHHLLVALVDSEYAIRSSGWEWTLGIGIIPAMILATVNIRNYRETLNFLIKRKYILVPLFLSISVVYRACYLLINEVAPIPVVDRVPYRMGIYWFVALLLISFKNLDQMSQKTTNLARSLYLFSLLLLPILVGFESKGWFMRLSLNKSDFSLFKLQHISQPDRSIFYESSIVLGFVISAFTMAMTFLLLWRRFPREKS